MLLFPNAKINLGLHIVEKRPDGFHTIESVFYPIKGLNDAMECLPSNEFQFKGSGFAIGGKEDDNLVVKAYRILQKEYSLPPVTIHLHKHIPMGAGLGGGSADAAFMLRLLNERFGLKISSEQLKNYAAQLGSDCAFFIENEPAYVYGKGHELSPFALDLSTYDIVVVLPPVHVSTALAYSRVQPQQPSVNLKELLQGPMVYWKEALVNDFEASVFAQFPQLADIKTSLYEQGALYASMSGSGSAFYGIFGKGKYKGVKVKGCGLMLG